MFVSGAGDILRTPRVKPALERVTAGVLIGFGIRLAAEGRAITMSGKVTVLCYGVMRSSVSSGLLGSV